MKSTMIRVILTLAVVLGLGFINFTARTVAPLVSSKAAVEQLKDNDAAYVQAKAGMWFNGSGVPNVVGLLLLAALWWKPVANKFRSPAILSPLLLLALGSVTTRAAVMDLDQEEWKNIRPNQTAFLVPMVGENKRSQAAFDSAAYLDSLKVAAKRVQIPHMLWTQVGRVWNGKKFVPSATLYIVTREPYSRSWQKESTRGTSPKDEGTYVESKESVNIDFGTMISAEIEETNAALYMYHFGINNLLDPGDDADFPSAVYAKPLDLVMDTIVFNDAHRKLAREFGKRTLIECISQKADIFAAVESELKTDYAAMGITIKYFGLGSQLNLDPKIQDAINSVAIAALDAQAVSNRLLTIPVMQALANIEIKKGVAAATAKWTGTLPNLPSFVVVPAGFWEKFSDWLTPAPVSAGPAPGGAPGK